MESQSVFGFYGFRACLRHLHDAAERRLAFLLFFLGAGLVLVHPCAGQTWTATGSLATARQEHSATLLPNGKVLVAGGFDGSGTVLASAELVRSGEGPDGYRQPRHRTPSSRGNVAAQRPGARRRWSWRTYDLLASAELYDPASGTWTATGSLTTARQLPTATLLPNGQVLVAGGVGQPPELLASAELVMIRASGTWTATGSLATTAREEHSATLLPNGKVLVAGGIGTINFPAIAELYDPASGTRRRPAASSPHAMLTRRRCCPMVTCSWQQETAAEALSRARNCIRRRRPSTSRPVC